MDRPSICNDLECLCLYHDGTQTFCVGQTPERKDIIDGKEHTNNYQFCIYTNLSGWRKHRLNKADLSLIAKAMLTALATHGERINLNFYLSSLKDSFYMDGKVIVVGKEPKIEANNQKGE